MSTAERASTLIRVLLASAVTICASLAQAEECESTVDMADSLKFHKMHVECDEEATVIFDPGAAQSAGVNDAMEVGSRDDSNVVKTYEQSPVAANSGNIDVHNIDRQSATTAEMAHKAANVASIFDIRAPFRRGGGPHGAITDLFAQMVAHCPHGWEKLREWVESAQMDYFLHYRLRCVDSNAN